MQFKLTVRVDLDTLKKCYREGMGLGQEEKLPCVSEMIENEVGWLNDSGIALVELEETEG